jgi:predicted ATP-dependent protease
MVRELTVKDVRWSCPADWLPWETTDDIEAATSIVGQDRAVDAIAFGLGVQSIGFNIFVTGLSGTGRLTTIKTFLEEQARGKDRPDDVCFVFDFDHPDTPRAVFLAAGAGRRFREAMDSMIEDLAQHLPRTLTDTQFIRNLESAVKDLRAEQQKLVSTFEKEVQEAGFALVQVQVGPMTRPQVLPVVDGEPVAMEDLGEAADEAEREAFVARHRELVDRMRDVFNGVNRLREQEKERALGVRNELLAPIFAEAVDRVRQRVGDPGIEDYLSRLEKDLADRLDQFGAEVPEGVDPFMRWRVNLAVNNGAGDGLPVVMETEPSYHNLFGTIERSLTPTGETTTSFLKIRAGSLLRANGGFLVLSAEDLFADPRVWPSLKRALKFRRAQIQSLEGMLMGAAALKPEAVPLDVKVVVIGHRALYDALYRHDRDFAKVFKILADFDAAMKVEKNQVADLLSVLAKVIADEELLPMDRSGMEAILEIAMREAPGRKKFSSRFSDLADIVREASWLARRQDRERIGRAEVTNAMAASHQRHSLSEDRVHELITDGVIRVETEGEAAGQVNGLAVYDLGHHRFGKPTRITARVGLGRDGIINIERQAGLSGPTHDKGVQILTGFLRGTFAQVTPLSLACSVTFEQSYGGIDGDSASSTEVYAILSALSDIPIRQDVAVTGSVDQFGRIQSIGGVNEKIEGFYRVCASRGLTGTQGVMIPASDVDALHLDTDVADAIAAGTFHVWAVSDIREGIELLTGRPAGERDDEGDFPDGSVYAGVANRLALMAVLIRSAGKTTSENGDESAEEPKDGEEGPGKDPEDTPDDPPDETPDDPPDEPEK